MQQQYSSSPNLGSSVDPQNQSFLDDTWIHRLFLEKGETATPATFPNYRQHFSPPITYEPVDFGNSNPSSIPGDSALARPSAAIQDAGWTDGYHDQQQANFYQTAQTHDVNMLGIFEPIRDMNPNPYAQQYVNGTTLPGPDDPIPETQFAVSEMDISSYLNLPTSPSYPTGSGSNSSSHALSTLSHSQHAPSTVPTSAPAASLRNQTKYKEYTSPSAASAGYSRLQRKRTHEFVHEDREAAKKEQEQLGGEGRQIKRARTFKQEDNTIVKEEENDGGNGGEHLPTGGRGDVDKCGSEPEVKMFACPFFKHDPKRNMKGQACNGPGFKKFDQLKEHITSRTHFHRFSCPHCGHPFHREPSLLKHLEKRECHRYSREMFPEQIAEDVKRTFGGGWMRRRSGEEKWDGLWRVLFPGEEVPQSCYHHENTASPPSSSKRGGGGSTPATAALGTTTHLHLIQEFKRQLTGIFHGKLRAAGGGDQGPVLRRLEESFREMEQRTTYADGVFGFKGAAAGVGARDGVHGGQRRGKSKGKGKARAGAIGTGW
ncbi:hypothetical protein MKZ38_010116 [Zalerion maritima]|uniref:C2H2-type domain-containing protein n=1 Tax=Zalerion maritima TaxID=339359 RepID=A0AAD5WSN4_9PEZI|nr:hypothetical protein MKZ38_010116 [Zalerion maritima]